MRILLVGAGAVGEAIVALAARRPYFEHFAVADRDSGRANEVVARLGDHRFSAHSVDARDATTIADLIRGVDADAVVNACDPRLNMPIFEAAFGSRSTYIDMALSLSRPDSDDPYHRLGTPLGHEQLERAATWEKAELLAIVGMGAEPGLSDVFARHAADHLFRQINEIGVRDGANLVVDGYEFAPTFSIWTTIEECLNPPVIYERARGWFTTEPFSQPEEFDFPGGIGLIECVNVEHEEVFLIPRWVECERVTFKYGLGSEFVNALRVLHQVGLDRTSPVRVGDVEVSPRDVVAACLPDPARLGDRMRGKTCAGIYVDGVGIDGAPRAVYLYHVVDNGDSMREYGCQAVALQTAIGPVAALELVAGGEWAGAGVLGPEAFDATPFLDLMSAYGMPHALQERPPSDGS